MFRRRYFVAICKIVSYTISFLNPSFRFMNFSHSLKNPSMWDVLYVIGKTIIYIINATYYWCTFIFFNNPKLIPLNFFFFHFLLNIQCSRKNGTVTFFRCKKNIIKWYIWLILMIGGKGKSFSHNEHALNINSLNKQKT